MIFNRFRGPIMRVLLPVVLFSFSLGVAAADLSRFDGLWVVDIKPTADVWEKAGQPMDKSVYALFSAHSMHLDFTNGMIVEGMVIGYEQPGEPFTVREREKDRYELDIDGRRKRTFLWQVVDDNHIILSVPDGESPPLHFLRENLQQYSGVWKVINVEAILAQVETMMKKDGKPMNAQGKKRTRQILSTMHMRIDFTRKTLSWEDEKGDGVYGEPAGEFVVDNRQENGATLVFGGDKRDAKLRIFGPAKISVTDRGIPFEMERVSGL